MLILVRKRLLAGDFISSLKLLQNYLPTNISHHLYSAKKLQCTDLFLRPKRCCVCSAGCG
jgi:hypothetical protein